MDLFANHMRLDLFKSYSKLFTKKLTLLPIHSNSVEAVDNLFLNLEYNSLEKTPRRYEHLIKRKRLADIRYFKIMVAEAMFLEGGNLWADFSRVAHVWNLVTNLMIKKQFYDGFDISYWYYFDEARLLTNMASLRAQVKIYGEKNGLSYDQQQFLLKKYTFKKGAKLLKYRRLLKIKLIKKKAPRDKFLTLLKKSKKKVSNLQWKHKKAKMRLNSRDNLRSHILHKMKTNYLLKADTHLDYYFKVPIYWYFSTIEKANFFMNIL